MAEKPSQRIIQPKQPKPHQPRVPARTPEDWQRQEAAEKLVAKAESPDDVIAEIVGSEFLQTDYTEDGFRYQDGRRFNVSRFARFRKAVIDYVDNETIAVARQLAVNKMGYLYFPVIPGRQFDPEHVKKQLALRARANQN